ncbi:MAG: SprT-like domain-containing protein [Nitrospirae bacterium]|nr:SprT-like domain-containing protein [Nitrospirota bacterium]
MKEDLTTSTAVVALSPEGLQARWRDLNVRYFAGLLPPIAVVQSRRLTSSVGMFVSRGGPRVPQLGMTGRSRREIRLSLPLLERLAKRTPYAEQELLNTLAHEMIHQWQFDVLNRRPDHGLDFLRKMTEMNRSGEVAITMYHSLQKEVRALSRFAWRCKDCGRVYRRQRRTIEPTRHHCGACRGSLQELFPVTPPSSKQALCRAARQSEKQGLRPQPKRRDKSPEQLTLALT